MTDRIWIGSFSATGFDRIGLRHKLPGQPWEQPYKDHAIPRPSPETKATRDRYERGKLVDRQELAECSAIYDTKRFALQKEFSRAGTGYIVDERVAKILEPFDLGPGGMFPYTIYEADEITSISAQWSMLGKGALKQSFRPDISKHRFLECLFDGKGEKDSMYNIAVPLGDDVLAFSSAAREGADMWHEAELLYTFCFSDQLGQALQDAGLGHWFRLQSARIVD